MDEYETDYELPVDHSEKPLSLLELINLRDNTNNPFNHADGRLIRNHWVFNAGYIDSEEAVDFVSVESAYYPDLAVYYADEADRWL